MYYRDLTDENAVVLARGRTDPPLSMGSIPVITVMGLNHDGLESYRIYDTMDISVRSYPTDTVRMRESLHAILRLHHQMDTVEGIRGRSCAVAEKWKDGTWNRIKSSA